MKLGVDGVIPGISSLAVDKCIELYKFACNNQYEEAAKVQKELHEIQTVIFGARGQHWGNGHKYALSLLGICDDYVSTTLLPLTEEDKETIKAVVRKYNIS